MFCDEEILKVYMGVVEEDDVYNHNAFLDCYRDLAYHCTEGYRLVLETKNYTISLSYDGVKIEKKELLCEKYGEWLQNGVEYFDKEVPWIHLETTLFVGERLISVSKMDDYFLLQFDDFEMKVVPHEKDDGIEGLYNELYWSYNYILGCDRHLKKCCPHCSGQGEILLDFVRDYVVRCSECKMSTYANMNLINAIDDWNNGEVPCDLSDINIE